MDVVLETIRAGGGAERLGSSVQGGSCRVSTAGSGDMVMVMGAGLPLGGGTDTAGEQYSGCRPASKGTSVYQLFVSGRRLLWTISAKSSTGGVLQDVRLQVVQQKNLPLHEGRRSCR